MAALFIMCRRLLQYPGDINSDRLAHYFLTVLEVYCFLETEFFLGG